MKRKSLIALIIILLLTGCGNKEPGYYSSKDTWDYQYDKLLGEEMEFTAGEAKTYLTGKYLGTYVIKAYVYRMDGSYISIKDRKSDKDYYQILLENDVDKVDYEQTIYVKINGIGSIGTTTAKLIHENDIEEWYNVVTVEEIIELEKLLKETTYTVYGKVDSCEKKEKYYLANITSTNNGYMKPGKVEENWIYAEVNENLNVGDYVKLECSSNNVLDTFIELTECELIDSGDQYRNKVDLVD